MMWFVSSSFFPLVVVCVTHLMFGHCLCDALVVLTAFSIFGVENHEMLLRLFCSFHLGVAGCAMLLLFWSFFQFQCCFVCDALSGFWGIVV